MMEELLSGKKDFNELEENAVFDLERIGFVPEYVSIRKADDLDEAEPGDRDQVILAATFLGDTRLIDNVIVNL